MKTGDKVRFLNDVGGGKVLRVEGKIAIICDEDGFEIPTPISNVVVVSDGKAAGASAGSAAKVDTLAKQYTTKHEHRAKASGAPPSARQAQGSPENRVGDNRFSTGIPEEPSTENPVERDAPGESYELMLAFLPPKNEKTDLYLLNDSAYRALYSVGMYERDGSVQPLAQGQMEGDSKLMIKSLSVSRLRDFQTLRVEVVLYKNITYKPQNLDAVDVKLNPLKFFRQGAFAENEFFEENALIIRLFSSESAEKEKMRSVSVEEIKEAIQQKNDVQPAPQKPEPQPELEEVDLHAEMLVSDVQKFSAGELLELQMSRFTATLENALTSGRKGRIVFIHGIGNGKLKQELRSYLTKNHPLMSFQDASFRQYGYGATMVFLG
ncbi:MAG: DUF2027 domain-containing protein [Prevotellaceae bacterium]|nr:DUF2027 domain-containing protein [Prevotellaceae bacterium]